jgi:hypothetical protein
MRYQTSYEWVAETQDEHGDIIDCRHNECLKKLKPKHYEVIGLVKDIGNDSEGLQDRTWAYIDESGKLPTEFEDGTLVPKRFLKNNLDFGKISA